MKSLLEVNALQPSACVQPQCSACFKNCLNDLLGLAAAPAKERACCSAEGVPAAASALTAFAPELLLIAVLPCDSSSWVDSLPGLPSGTAKENLTLGGVACAALGVAFGICKGVRRRALPGMALSGAGLKAEPAVALPWAASS